MFTVKNVVRPVYSVTSSELFYMYVMIMAQK